MAHFSIPYKLAASSIFYFGCDFILCRIATVSCNIKPNWNCYLVLYFIDIFRFLYSEPIFTVSFHIISTGKKRVSGFTDCSLVILTWGHLSFLARAHELTLLQKLPSRNFSMNDFSDYVNFSNPSSFFHFDDQVYFVQIKNSFLQNYF